jgi:enamine deaminase RidA (YjgF/YER057c/UK114 family)
MSSTRGSTTFHCPATLPPPVGYSHVVQLTGGTLVYIAGQMARTADGNLVGADDFGAQVEQCFENIKLAIESVGGTMHDIVKLNYFCDQRVPLTELRAVVEKRDRYVNVDRPPASTFVAVSRLARAEWLIEIEAVAHLAQRAGARE